MHMWTRHRLHLPIAMLAALGITGGVAAETAAAAEAEAEAAETAATEASAAAVQDDVAPNSGMLGFSAGVDFVSDYYFRGIIQETGGFIAQPFLDASMSLGPVSITAGTWNSLHSVGDDGFVNEGAPRIYYESDFYAGLGIAAGDMVGIDLTYTAYMSPRGSWGTTKEVALGLSFDTFAAPYATFAFEAAGGADGGPNEGSYVEIGFEPAVPLEDAPVSLSFPVTFRRQHEQLLRVPERHGRLVGRRGRLLQRRGVARRAAARPGGVRLVGPRRRGERAGVRRGREDAQRRGQGHQGHRAVRHQPGLLRVALPPVGP